MVRPTFLKKIVSFRNGQADVFEKKYLALGKGRPTFLKKIVSFCKGQADVLEKNT